MEPEVRRLLEARRQLLEERAAAGGPAAELAEAIGQMGRLYHAYDLTAAAAAHYENARRLEPNDFRWVYLLGLARQTRGEDSTCAFALRGLGEIALRGGDAPAAVGLFQDALTLQPRAASLHFLVATALKEAGEPDAAAAHLELYSDVPVELADPLAEAMAAEASGAATWLLRGHTSLKEGRLREAVLSYRRALELDPENVAGRESLAFALADLGEVEGSLAELRRLADGGGGSARTHFLLGRLLAGRGDDLAAVEHYRQAVELNPADEDALFNTASTLARLGDFEAAAAGYDRLLRLDSRDVEARYRRALVLQALGRLPEALAELERASADEPGNEEIRARLLAVRQAAAARE